MEKQLQNITSSCTSGNQLAAFTLLELMAGMIASGIVITAIWSALHLVGSRAALSTTAGETSEEISLFYRTFSLEFERADEVILSGEEILLSDSGTARSIRYEVRENDVTRSDGFRTDTFHVTVRELRSTGEDAVEANAPVNSVSFSILNQSSVLDVFLRRNQSAFLIVRDHDRHFTTEE